MTESKRSSRRYPTGGKRGLETRERILNAAVEVLRTEGALAITTRRVAAEAEANQALVHYYFDSIEQLMFEVVERIASVSVEMHLQRYDNDRPFIDSWRDDMESLLARDAQSGMNHVWFQAMSVVSTTPSLLERYATVHRVRSRNVLKKAIARELRGRIPDDEVDREAEELAALITLVRVGLVIDTLLGSQNAHQRVVAMVDDVLVARLGEPTGSQAGKPKVRAEKAARIP